MVFPINHIYCLNLDKRKDRWELFKQLNISNVERFPATDGNSLKPVKYLNKGEVGIIHSFIRIFEDAIKNDYESIMILEDDVYFTGNDTEFNEYMSQVPNDWEFIHLGALVNANKIDFISNNIYKLNSEMFTTHALIIRKELYYTILNIISSYKRRLDFMLAPYYSRWKAYGFFPSFALQRESYSDIRQSVVNYGDLIINRERWLLNE